MLNPARSRARRRAFAIAWFRFSMPHHATRSAGVKQLLDISARRWHRCECGRGFRDPDDLGLIFASSAGLSCLVVVSLSAANEN